MSDFDQSNAAGVASFSRSLQFPAEDEGKSLTELAQRDFEATLQLLAERAAHLTGASGTAIALDEDGAMICRASVGDCAPAAESVIDVMSGLSAESIRTRRLMHCEDTIADPRVNREACRARGIASVVVLPLIRDERVFGIFELLSHQPNAFGERDFAAIERLGEMIQTTLDHSEAASRAQNVILGAPSNAAKQDPAPAPKPLEAQRDPNPQSLDRANIARCSACGFPVSQGRALCLDCEREGQSADAGPNFQFGGTEPRNGNWISSNAYIIGIVAVAAATLALVLWMKS